MTMNRKRDERVVEEMARGGKMSRRTEYFVGKLRASSDVLGSGDDISCVVDFEDLLRILNPKLPPTKG